MIKTLVAVKICFFMLITIYINGCIDNKKSETHFENTTYIITVKTPNSILMGSDTRLNIFHDVEINGIKYQKITAIADCIRKTFYISSAQVGINFLGIGYFEDDELNNNNKYPLSHFIKKLNNQIIKGSAKDKFNFIYQYFISLSEHQNTGQYVKGIMTCFKNDSSYVCTFNTYNNSFKISELQMENFVDSENNRNSFPSSRQSIITEINNRIKQKSFEKPYSIGGPIEIIELLPDNTFQYVQKSNYIFNGTHQELISCFNTNINKINGKIINPPVLQRYEF